MSVQDYTVLAGGAEASQMLMHMLPPLMARL